VTRASTSSTRPCSPTFPPTSPTTSRRTCFRSCSSAARRCTATSRTGTGATSATSRRTAGAAGRLGRAGAYRDAGVRDRRPRLGGGGDDPGSGCAHRRPALIGEHVKVEAGATLREYLRRRQQLRHQVGRVPHRATLHDNAYIGRGATSAARDRPQRRHPRQRAHRRRRGAGRRMLHRQGSAAASPNVKVYPFKRVDPGHRHHALDHRESSARARCSLGAGVAGLINVDITPICRAPGDGVRLDAQARARGRAVARRITRLAHHQARADRRVNGSGVHVADLEGRRSRWRASTCARRDRGAACGGRCPATAMLERVDLHVRLQQRFLAMKHSSPSTTPSSMRALARMSALRPITAPRMFAPARCTRCRAASARWRNAPT